MSENITKAGFLVPLPNLTGKPPEEVLPWFKERLGDPDIFCGEDDWAYGRHPGVIRGYCGAEGTYFLALWIAHDEMLFMPSLKITLGQIKVVADWYHTHFGVDPDTVEVVSYTHYNGVDDPVNDGTLCYNPGDRGYDIRKFPAGLLLED